MPCDLYLEHLNRRLKKTIRHLRSNVTPSILQRAAKAVGIVDDICGAFNKSLGVSADSTKHSTPPNEKDFKRVLDQLTECEIFCNQKNRSHKKFSFTNSLQEKTNYDNAIDWIVENVIPSAIFL